MTSDIDRRTVVVSAAGMVAAAAALTACSTYGETGSEPAPATQAAPAAGGGAPAPADALAKTADVPVGGGVIVGTTVVTQPTAGTFVGLDSTCTHAGCKVSSVADGAILCRCHNSKFGLDGAVLSGPAPRPLAAKSVRVQGDSIVSG
ncbi:QcrA and Rieske domain-containing protein [Nocardia bovistercoris]|uniref:Cytochrome bc1 complex Rieske iron-sulfur subunit n=1 Tax=Nocardia bovistercoris TaxID=2785916 RepID=A0A931N5R5_9NOCA|nr:Rieske (2Fe-2S) protein [Nocardia bovistercoris]MBH0780139.1 Rieske (2Fe-2S) protein [Nocardia bovistercoris]